MKYALRIHLTFYYDGPDIHAIAAALPVPPRRVKARGEHDAARELPRHGLISFASEAEFPDAGIDRHCDNFLSMMAPNHTRLTGLAARSVVKMTVTVNRRGRFPSLYLPASLITFAAGLRADLDIDVYEDAPDANDTP